MLISGNDIVHTCKVNWKRTSRTVPYCKRSILYFYRRIRYHNYFHFN